MALQQEVHQIKGMQRDLTISKFSPEFAFDCQNIRITARDNNTLLSVTNERGTDLVELKGTDNNTFTLQGVTIGYCVLNKYLVLFNTTNVTDYIYRLEPKNGYFECVQLFTGSLNFSTSAPIETLGNYETEDIQKVYWVDGVNQPRVINIMNTSVTESNLYDFKLTVALPTVTINKEYGAGEFPSGTIQYAVSYYRRYGQQTPLIYISDLQYLTFEDRAGSPEENVNCYFTIKLSNLDSDYDYVRLYSIIRTSVDATPVVKLVTEQQISNSTCIFTDYNNIGETIDSSTLLYLGGQNITASTICSKDNTLFLGEVTLNDLVLTTSEKENIKNNSTVAFDRRQIENEESGNISYSYKMQLNKSSKEIKHFKGGETYRIGVQFQDEYGNFTQPVYIGDYKNTLYPYSTGSTYFLPYITANIHVPSSIRCISARLVMAVPNPSDRTILAQGLICPTVFNASDRYENSPYGQPSWFTRFLANEGNEYIPAHNHYQTIHYEVQVDPNPDDEDTIPTKDVTTSITTYNYILSWVVNKEMQGEGDTQTEVITGYTVTLKFTTGATIIDGVTYSSWNDARYSVSQQRIALDKIRADAPTEDGSQNITMTEQYTTQPLSDNIVISPYLYLVDTNIVDMLTPEVDDIDGTLSNVKFRIIGYTTLYSNMTDFSIDASAGRVASAARALNHNFTNRGGFTTAYPLWQDYYQHSESYPMFGTITYEEMRNYWVYPWHRNGSLNDDPVPTSNDGTRTAVLNRKIISNLWYCSDYTLLSPNSVALKGIYNMDITNVCKIDTDDNVKAYRIDNGSTYYTYYGNIDKVVTVGLEEGTNSYDIYYTSPENNYPSKEASSEEGVDPVSMKYKSSAHLTFAFPESNTILPRISNNEKAITITGLPVWQKVDGLIKRLSYVSSTTPSNPSIGQYWFNPSNNNVYIYTTTLNDNSPAWRQYDLTIGEIFITENQVVYIAKQFPSGTISLVNNNTLNQPSLLQDAGLGFQYLYIGEIYRDIDASELYGGDSASALANNQWIPISDSIPVSGTSVSINAYEGDTYFQRYDCLKTYSFTEEDQNSIVDIPSFMVETHINIDGRYDRNRGLENNLSINPTNFNLFNPVYSQSNNYFTYRILDEQYNQNYFPTTVTWSNEKQIGEIIDTWLDVNLGSSLVVDGDKGKIVSLNTFNNEIYCFQERGLSNILFNSRVQIPASDGVPIEITNGLKVSGKRYVSNSIGCSNKWSIAESPSGLYFVDNETNSIYLFNGQIQSLSDKLGLRQWISENNSNNEWDPVDYGNFRTFYDKNNNDVYFTNSSTSLCYSELLGQFTSFMSYEKVPAMFNIGSEFYSIKDSQLWHNFSGDYNMFYGTFKPYSITIIANSNEPYDKVFNTVEFRADSWDGDTLINNQTFDTLDVWNEYQHGTSTLTNVIGKPSPLKKKFRVWRANIPRDNSNKMDRIRNTWAYVKLSMNTQNTWRTELHDIMVHYFM